MAAKRKVVTVRFMTSCVTDQHSYAVGQVVELSPDDAEGFMKAGLAVEVADGDLRNPDQRLTHGRALRSARERAREGGLSLPALVGLEAVALEDAEAEAQR